MDGGFIGGDWHRPEGAQNSLLGERNVVVWGYVIIDKFHSEPVYQTMYRNLCTTFTICYSKPKANKGFITCQIWGDEPAAHIATCLEKGDWVFIAGKIKLKKYTVRNGADAGMEKKRMYLTPVILIPLPLVEGLLAVASSSKISKIIQEEELEAGSDTVESTMDYGTPQETEDDGYDYELSV